MSFTAAQQEAIAARGNVLVVAGAGTGKTRTLVERCLSCLLEERPRASLEEILVVTFTDAAAAEMRQRIRDRLEQELERHPAEAYWQEQLALFDTAHIGTLHSFCLQLVRQHFYELELDPQLTVLAEEEARLLADETLDALLQKHYAGRGKAAEAVQQLIQAQGRGWDKPIRTLVLRLHHYTQTLPDPAGWLHSQLELFAAPQPKAWKQWWVGAVNSWRQSWPPFLEKLKAHNAVAAKCLSALEALPARLSELETAAALQTVSAALQECPNGKKTLWLKPLESFREETRFLSSLTRSQPVGKASESSPPDPLAEDWGWVRRQMTTLLQLAREFTKAFAEAKRELGVVDFHDLEQYALRLLWDPQAGQPTKIARQWRKRLRFVFVDEYQDINAAQDKIIEAISREGAEANRFLVGDVKQSIYRFRLADPHIFQNYVGQWGDGQGKVIPLADNFRSREGILDFINSLFGLLMRRDIGGVQYDEQARLRFGALEERLALAAGRLSDSAPAPSCSPSKAHGESKTRTAERSSPVPANSSPRVELHLRFRGQTDSDPEAEPNEALAEVRDLEEADKEARLVALRLRELKAGQHPIWDEAARQFRPVDWRDMAVLLRSPANKAESYAKEFTRLNVPLQVARGGFYESLEISDLLSLLQLLDNPLQDLPALAVLHSPLVGLTLDELAAVRLTVAKAHFWTALLRWQEAKVQSPKSKVQSQEPGASSQWSVVSKKLEEEADHGPRTTDSADTLRKVTTFLDRFTRWRRLARQVSLSRCLEAVLAETHYADWLLTQPRGEQRHANVQRLVGLAQQFDQFQRQGLFRFLRFIEAQQMAQTEPEVAPVSEENAVRLMSIHQSKGLEFPVVVVADLGKAFNLSDLRAELILDEDYGLCPQIKPPHIGQRYPSLPFWLARRRQQRELLGEELRLLYVAVTRARDTLVLSGTLSATNFNKVWRQRGDAGLTALLAARSYSDWLGLWFAQNAAPADNARQGETAGLHWTLHDDAKLVMSGVEAVPEAAPDDSALDAKPEVWQQLQQRLSWQYLFATATRQPAKTSVSVLRRRAALAEDEEAMPFFGVQGPRSKVQSPEAKGQSLQPGEDTRVESHHVSGFTHHAPRTTQPPSATPHSALRAPHSSAADIGTAHHAFLQRVSLERVEGAAALKAEAERLLRQGALRAEEVALLDFEGLAAFWNSALGRKVLAQAPFVHRELAFTARFSPNELAQLIGKPPQASLEVEFVVVQGVADLVVIRPEEIWLLDFKTDHVEPGELPAKARLYTPQLQLYARALARIYRRPVSSSWLYFLARQTAVAVRNP